MAIVTYSCTKCKPIDKSILEVYIALKDLDNTASANEDERVAAEEARVEAEAARAEEFALLHEQAGGDHSVAEGDHTRAEADHATASADHENAVADRNGYDADHTAAVADHAVAASDHVRAEQDHTRAEADHTRTLGYGEISERDHARAEEDHEAIFGDHSIFVDDHNQYLADHATAEEDHAAAVAATAAANAAGITSASASVDSNVGTPSVDVSLVNKQLSLSFHNIKGDKGEKGDRGDGVIPVVNDLVTGGTDAALSAEMGKTLNTTKQATLVSGTNIKTVNGESLLGDGNIIAGDPNAVKYVEQTLTDAQKAQARTNIGAYQKPSGGIPKADLDTGVQGSLDLADTAIQAQPVGSITPPADPSEWATAEEVAQLEAKVDEKFDEFDLYKDDLYVTDSAGNVIAKIDKNGVESVDFKAGDKKLSEMPKDTLSETIIPDYYKKEFYISDSNGNVVMKVSKDGLETIAIKSANMQKNDWLGKVLSVYGDSVVAINDGDYTYPFPFDTTARTWMWANRVAEYFKMSKQYGRGIGGSGYKWTTQGSNGGCVAFVSDTGRPLGRLQEYTLDDWNALETKVYPPGVTAEMISGGTAFAIRSSMCSWSRITKMYPESIKDSISVILLLAHNDAAESTDPSFIDNDTTDPEWASSDYYSTYDGDYNITTFKGAIASLIMKLQVWMPNAIIVLLTPIQGYGPTPGEPNTNLALTGLRGQYAYVETVHTMLGIPLIDVFGSCGINGLNRASYISDTIHPYTEAGGKMIARAIVGGLKTILPFDSMNF